MKSGDSKGTLMLVTSFSPSPMGGSERQAYLLAKELVSRGQTVYLVAIGESHSRSYEQVEGVHVFRIKSWVFNLFFFRKSSGQAKPVRVLYEKGNSNNFKVVGRKSLFSFIPYFVFLTKSLLLLSRRSLRCSVVYVPIMEWTAVVGAIIARVKGCQVVIKDSTMNGITNLLRYPFGRQMQAFLLAHAHFVAMTRAIESNLRNAGARVHQITRIPNGTMDVTEARQPIPYKVVFIGNLYQQPAKGVDVLLQAWRSVVMQYPQASLHILGDGYHQGYDQLVRDLGVEQTVLFRGKVNEVKRELLSCCCFVLPSRREGMSNALLEAMACGAPCVATNISGSQDLIIDGENGRLVEPEDEVALANAIQCMLEDPARSEAMGRKAKETIQSNFLLSTITDKYLSLLAEKGA